MPNEELFSGIPSLDDAQGLEAYMSNATLEGMGLGQDTSIPAALQTTEETPEQEAPAATGYTAEQVQQMVAQAQAYGAQQQAAAYQQQMAQMQAQRQQQAQPQQTYTPRQAAIIKELIDRGVPMSRIQQALNGGAQQASQQNAIAQRLAEVENYLQNQQYIAAQNEFIDKMTTFGDKFGLSENDLVTFGNKAMSMGINLTTVSDVEAVFRAVYPDQYAIRSQRIAASSAPIYGGSSTPEAPRASAVRMEDAYVDQFLKRAMPNQYGMNTK